MSTKNISLLQNDLTVLPTELGNEINRLPDELILKIFEDVGLEGLHSIPPTARRIYDIAQDRTLWPLSQFIGFVAAKDWASAHKVVHAHGRGAFKTLPSTEIVNFRHLASAIYAAISANRMDELMCLLEILEHGGYQTSEITILTLSAISKAIGNGCQDIAIVLLSRMSPLSLHLHGRNLMEVAVRADNLSIVELLLDLPKKGDWTCREIAASLAEAVLWKSENQLDIVKTLLSHPSIRGMDLSVQELTLEQHIDDLPEQVRENILARNHVRIAMLEAAFRGQPSIVEMLLGVGDYRLWITKVVALGIHNATISLGGPGQYWSVIKTLQSFDPLAGPLSLLPASHYFPNRRRQLERY